MIGTITPSAKLEMQTGNTAVGTCESFATLSYTQPNQPNQPNMEKQIKVVVFLTEIENNKIISSTFLNEGWIRKPHTNADLNLLAVKEFNLSLDNLDKIVVKEIYAIIF
jgi:hypothetical protein